MSHLRNGSSRASESRENVGKSVSENVKKEENQHLKVG